MPAGILFLTGSSRVASLISTPVSPVRLTTKKRPSRYVFGFVERNSAADVVMAKLHHPVDQAGKYVLPRGDGFGCPKFGAQSLLGICDS